MGGDAAGERQEAGEEFMNRAEEKSDVTIERVDILSATARGLILALNAELSGRYPEQGACHFRLDAEEVSPSRSVYGGVSREQADWLRGGEKN